MGIMSLVFGCQNCQPSTSSTSSGSGDHQINKDRVLAPTDLSVPTPMTPGSLESIRSVPVLESPRYFSPEEADALKKLAKEKKRNAAASVDAYAAMRKIENADLVVHSEHRRYQRKLATNEAEKKAADVRYGNRLHGLRKRYAELNASLESAEKKANDRVAAIKASYL